MKRSALLLAALAALLVAVSAPSSPAETAGPALTRLPRAAAAGELSQYGHVKALTRRGTRFQLRFDPAFWLGGVTANRAAAEDGVVEPGEPVPNDYYIRDESHELLTYLVPASAKVTVLDKQLRPFRITAAELAQVVKGRNPTGRPLYDRSNGLGFWVLVDLDTVKAIDQQYQP